MSLLAPLFASGAPSPRLAIIGGRLEDDNRDIYREMRRLSEGKVLIFPTASSEPEEVGEETRAAFEMHGFTAEVVPLQVENASVRAYDPALVQKISEFGSAYFTGGDQNKIPRALLQNGAETPVLKALRAALQKGGMLAGSSAGAAIMSEAMICGGTSFEAMAHGVTDDPNKPGIMIGQGLGFFKQGLVDQHFIKRGRLARLVVAMAHAGHDRGFGVDENTALIIDGAQSRVCGEYGVFVVDMRKANIDPVKRIFDGIRLSYLDHGDTLDLLTFKSKPSEFKRRVRENEILYRAPARSRRNAFGAYAIYDLVTRLVFADQASYTSDVLDSYDAKSGTCARFELRRVKRRSRCLMATPASGVRVTAVNLEASLRREACAALADQGGRLSAPIGESLNGRTRIILLGSSPVYYEGEEKRALARTIQGPVGVIAAASAEARRTAEDHVRLFAELGIEAVDLGITIENVDQAAEKLEALGQIAGMNSIFLCGGNQIRLVETLLHRGEESAVLGAIVAACSRGATLIGSSGAASALSSIMMAGGTTHDALRFGVASDPGHLGIAVQDGMGLFAAGVVDQNMISARRLGRLVVACVEENERFGFGVCEDSGVIASQSGYELEAFGRHGFVQVETDPIKKAPVGDRFMARGVRLRMFGPGDRLDLRSGAITRQASPDAAKAVFDQLIAQLECENRELELIKPIHIDPSARHALRMRISRDDDLSASVDLEAAREEHDA